jgi:hypothetical protein
MGPTLANSREARVEADRWRTTTSAHLRRRARHYRLAAAVAEGPRDELMFSELAMMFDKLAHEFRRFENGPHRASAGSETTSHRLPGASSTWLKRLVSA